MYQLDSWALGSPSLDILLFCSAGVWPSRELTLWEVPVFLPAMAQANYCSSTCGALAHSPFGSLLLPDNPTSDCTVPQVCTPLTISMSQSKLSSDGWNSGSLMEMAAHLVTLLSLICADSVGPITMLPNAYIASISNSRLFPSSMDMVTTLTLQHRRDMPPIIITSTLVFCKDRHRSASTADCKQPISINTKHTCLPPGALYLHLSWGERWHWCLVS